MPQAQPIAIENRAYLQEVEFTSNGDPKEKGDKFTVTFNPQSLKVNFANQKAGGDQAGGAAIQYVGRGTSKLSVELLFDVTVPQPNGETYDDVGHLLKNVERFIKPDTSKNVAKKRDEEAFVPPAVRFHWGKFFFDGVVDSIDETMDFFSHDGRPLRATVSLSISRQEIIPRAMGAGSPGTAPKELSKDGESLQSLMDRLGSGRDWKDVAAQNGIDNPRNVPPGTPLDVGSGGGALGAGLSGGFGVSGGFEGGVSGGFGAGVSGGFSAGVSGGFGASGSTSFANKLDVGVAGRMGFGASSRTRLSAGIKGSIR